MGTIYVVRHAQAAFGTDDYDRLTQTGFEQARLLGAYLGLRQVRFDAVCTGSLRHPKLAWVRWMVFRERPI
jgi:broad specificity phosphatase PhoE